MSRLFRGMSRLIRNAFGEDMSVTPFGGSPRTVRAMFREEPFTVIEQDGSFSTILLSLTGLKSDLDDIADSGSIELQDGRTFESISAAIPSGNPEADALVTLKLQVCHASH